MTDLLERLRRVEGDTTKHYRNPDGPEAADEIERLRQELRVQALEHLTVEGHWIEVEGRLREAHRYLVDENADIRKTLSKFANEKIALRWALRRIVEHCANDGLQNEMVAERVIDRIDEEARQTLKESGDD